ncbi:hypothetical protein PIB30_020808 [Stylosanthes scabra]|uniref:Uncharacterized protein n=1 Tax=Stylosanthes scabra TaxID=79078 RepID=A0ABU6T9F1_9FABA|nr:hypothetical protein [Stylosanthes scabra]
MIEGTRLARLEEMTLSNKNEIATVNRGLVEANERIADNQAQLATIEKLLRDSLKMKSRTEEVVTIEDCNTPILANHAADMFNQIEKLDLVGSERALRQPFKLEHVPEKITRGNPTRHSGFTFLTHVAYNSQNPIPEENRVEASHLPKISLASSLYPRRTTELRGITPLLPSLKDSEGTSVVPPGGKQG